MLDKDQLAALRAEEDAWGEHPECPVEVLADGTRVWRVPPGTEVEILMQTTGNLRVVLVDPKGAYGNWYVPPDQIAVRAGKSIWWSHWKFLRRLDYNPPPTREEAPEAADAPR